MDHTRPFTDEEARQLRRQDINREMPPSKLEPIREERPRARQALPPSPPAPEQANWKRKNMGRGCLSLIVFLILAMVMIGAAFYTYDLLFGPTPLEDLSPQEQESEALRRAESNVNVLFIGADDSGEAGSRSDTMIFAVFRPTDKDVSFLSIPRDSLVTIPGYGQDKLNAAYAYGGEELLKETVEDVLRTRIDHIVKMDFNSFPKIINAMGGIVIDVPQDMYYEDPYQDLVIDLKEGRQRLRGKDALAFVRWRDDGKGDLGRIERQQVFLQALGKKATHLWPHQALATAFVLQKEIDSDFSFPQMARLGLDMIGTGRDDIHSHHLEVDPQHINNVSYALLDQGNIDRTIADMETGIPNKY